MFHDVVVVLVNCPIILSDVLLNGPFNCAVVLFVLLGMVVKH